MFYYGGFRFRLDHQLKKKKWIAIMRMGLYKMKFKWKKLKFLVNEDDDYFVTGAVWRAWVYCVGIAIPSVHFGQTFVKSVFIRRKEIILRRTCTNVTLAMTFTMANVTRSTLPDVLKGSCEYEKLYSNLPFGWQIQWLAVPQHFLL